MSSTGKLYLIPVPIGEEYQLLHIPAYNLEVVSRLKLFIAEDAKTARRFLKTFKYPKIEEAEILLLNEHTKNNDVLALIKPLLSGQDVGLMSDAGCPGIADPGAEVVALAHQKNIPVQPLVGPSSIVMSIMASGFNGQNFAFVGYLPIDKVQRSKRLRELETMAIKQKQAQFFIETPYRNEAMFDNLLEVLNANTRLFMGININSARQQLLSKTVQEWKRLPKPFLHKIPVVFGIYQ
ncbi:MAG: SAM-dependent methyltransferase [Bacteroidia bacterium]|nr:SAM-dependent methyltransferase [Bacteroidia bacterium]